MKLFSKKETLAQSIAFMAIMAALNVIFVLMTTFIPLLLFVLVFILPLSCTLVILLCDKKYFPIYFFATTGLCLISTIWNISDTLFYIIPSLITGGLFGILIERKVNYSVTILLCSYLQFILSYLLLPLIELITDVKLLDVLSNLLGFSDNIYLSYMQPFGVFFVAILQEIVSFIVIKFGLKKLNFQMQENNNNYAIQIILLTNLLLTLLFVFIYPFITFVFFFASLYLTCFEIVEIIKTKRKLLIILLVAFAVIMIFLEAIVYPCIEEPLAPLFFEVYFYFVLILVFIKNWFVKRSLNN